MSEHSTDQTSGDLSSDAANTAAVVPSSSDLSSLPTQPLAASIDSPGVAPGQSELFASAIVNPRDPAGPDATKADAPKLDISKMDASRIDSPKIDSPKIDVSKLGAPSIDAPKMDTARTPGKIIVMSPSRDHAWSGDGDRAEASAAGRPGLFGKRRAAALAAVIALAAVAGALGGALATAGLKNFSGETPKVVNNRAVEDTMSRIETEIAALRTSLEHTSKLSVSQFNKASERLDKVEKAQTEPAAKLAKITEAVERLRAAPAPAAAAATSVAAAPAPAAQALPRETTASIASVASPALAPTPVPSPRPEMARLPTVEGWVLRDVADGGAVIEGRRGAFEVYAGDMIPGLGRVDAIRRQDGRWVVVTSKGLVVAR